jgi:hypothetical protein
MDVTARGETKANHSTSTRTPVRLPEDRRRASVGLGRPYKDELINLRFAADGGFEAGYKFHYQRSRAQAALNVIERPASTSSLQPPAVVPIGGQWWLDRAFGKIDTPPRPSRRERRHASGPPFTMFHELSPPTCSAN